MKVPRTQLVPGARTPARRGLSLVEVVVSMVVLVVAAGGAMGSLTSFVALESSSRETTLAYLEAQRVLEEIQSVEFEEAFARYNGTDADDPAGISPGDTFSIAALTPTEADADGLVGSILFPVDPADASILTEASTADVFGTAIDLDADGTPDVDDHSGDYQLLPVRVRVEWTGKGGNRSIELTTILRKP